jgi:hypothetical protein
MRSFLSLLALAAATACAGPNLVTNGSFEFVTGNLPMGWAWGEGRAKATMELRADGGVDGRNYLRISNPSARKANVFSLLSTSLAVKPNTDYMLSAYLRGVKPGAGFLGGGPGWKIRFGFPSGHTEWTRFGGTFRTGENQTRFRLLVLTESETKGFDIDAIQLEEGKTRSDYDSGLLPGALQVRVVPATDVGFGVNLVPNPSFEQVDGVRPKHWVWDSRNTDSTFAVSHDAHSGDRAVLITNKTPLAPHVYGQLVLMGGLRLEPGESYTLSAYVKSDEPGRAWIGGGDGWWMRIGMRGTRGKWQRVRRTFTAHNGDTSFPLMINTDSPTTGVLVDDIKLEKGLAATEFDAGRFAKVPVHIQLSLGEAVSCNGLRADFWSIVNIKEAAGEQKTTLTIRDTNGDYVARSVLPEPLPPGTHHLQITWAPPNNASANYEVALAVGDTVVSHTFELFTPTRFKTESARAQKALADLEATLAAADKAGVVCPYAKAARVIARHFLPLAQTKVQRGVTAEAVHDAVFLAELCAKQAASTQAAVRGDRQPVTIPDPDLGKIRICDGNFWVGDEPVMLVGGMGYGELKAALPNYRDYGFNVLGDDFNNGFTCFSNLRPNETLNPDTVPKLRKSWTELAQQNLAVASIPTLHYFPEWALRKYVDITGGSPVDCLPDWSGLGRNRGKRTKAYGAFFPFAIDSPNLRRLVSLYYEQFFPGLRGLPGFQVVWLMNEPTYTNTKDAHYVGLFRAFLKQKYGTIAALNQAWGTEHKDFAEIGHDTLPGSPARYDWLTFHQDQVASWFEWLGQQAREDNPDVVLSNKPMAWTLLHPETGIDFEREAELWDIPGCDAGRSPGSDEYAFNWHDPIQLFDFQKSVAPAKPLGDHEYHYVHQADVTPEYVRATYFQSYLHGLRMSQFWVWATGMIGEGKTGAGMSHTAWQQPRVAWGTATSALDLRRLAPYIAAFPGKPEVAIYFSKPSLYLQGNYSRSLSQAHAAATFLDVPVGFATDRMILAGKLSGYRLLIVPQAEFAEPKVREAILAFAKQGGKVLLTTGSLAKAPTGTGYAAIGAGGGVQIADKLDHGTLAKAVRSAGIAPIVQVASPADQKVECRSVQLNGKTVLYLLALGKEPVTIKLTAHGKPLGTWTDLVAGTKGKGSEFALAPMAFRLIQLD